MLRRSYTDYNLASAYTSRRIIGLVSARHVYDGNWTLMSKTTHSYDWDWNGDMFQDVPGGVQVANHDRANYGPAFISGRGNLSQVARYDVNDPNNANNTWQETKWRVNITGSVLMERDHFWHQSFVSYGDSFSDGANRNTFAYPTMVSDADGNNSFVQYNYDFGARTRVQGPPPANQPQGAIQSFAYDGAGRIDRVTTANNGAYTRYVYGPQYVQQFGSINNVADDSYAIQVFDGAGRVFASAGNHPGSAGGYSAQLTQYDLMGRPVKQSNPTEITSSWVPAGDDAAGWLFTGQTYNWQGKPLVTTNTDGTTKEASYGGCGCAGGEVVTLTDEGTIDGVVAKRRQQKIYSDVLGRTVKTELLNWQGGSVYSTVTNSFNARDQITLARQYAGPEGSGTYQDTIMTYDGRGRLKTRHLPEQDAGTATTYNYNSDDTVSSVTDARGASASYTYNARHLVTGINYSAPSGITPTAPVSYAYDAAGNRTSMTDGLGAMSYQYDQLSRLTSETRTINGVGAFPLGYSYNLAGALTSVTDPFGAQVGYVHDQSGRLTSVTGSGFPNVSTYASNFQYRASGALKHFDYGNNRTWDMSYNARLQPSSHQVTSLINKTYQYQADGKLSYSHDLMDQRFDRSYNYDHAARVTQGLSGAEARGEPATTDRPYKQTLTFDAFGHMLNRDKKHWTANSGLELPANNAYANNRNTSWTYDANGNLLQSQIPYISYEYDAAGRMGHTNSDSRVDITQTHDGDGQVLKRYEVDTIYEEGGSSHTETNTLYQLRSSALGGKVLTEIGAQGQKARTYVYADGALLAWQHVVYVNGVATSQGPVWEHRDPSNATYRNSGPTYADPENAAELDPLGSNAGLESPYQTNPPPQNHKPNIFYPAVSLSADSACMVDGLARNCAQAYYMLGNGTAEQCPNNDCGPKPTIDRARNEIVLRPLTQDPDTGLFGYYPLPLTVNELLPKNMRQKAKPHNSSQYDRLPGSGMTACLVMADIAEQEANTALYRGSDPSSALGIFDGEFSRLYHGGPIRGYNDADRWRDGQGRPKSMEYYASNGSGFKSQYRDTGNEGFPIGGYGAEQTHHFSFYLSLGINTRITNTNAAIYAYGYSQDNAGDQRLSASAYNYGLQLRNRPEGLGKIGNWIRRNICSSGGHGLYYRKGGGAN